MNSKGLLRSGAISTLVPQRVAVVVIGSCMIDLSCYAPQLPCPGETLIGHKFVQGNGGKGANQCVSATRLGASTALIARLGDDLFCEGYLESLAEDGVNIDHVKITQGCSSGMAQITVADNGENHIVIIPGANAKLTTADVLEAKHILDTAEVLVFQLETPIETTVEIMKMYHGKVKCIVNGAPAHPKPNSGLYTHCDVFCVNESEAEVMSGVPVRSESDAGKAIAKFLEKGCHTVIITMGPKGAVFASKDSPTPVHVPAKEVKPIDTTGAGDAFIGALAFFMAYHHELDMEEMIRRSCLIASASVLKPGTQNSFPHRADLPVELFV
ncbi:ribokinase [Anabrus simplex]|uniref:ribokinase n=1 Tax=Anabrus simplex TaxID=316456 RepID=UPI0035A2F7C8